MKSYFENFNRSLNYDDHSTRVFVFRTLLSICLLVEALLIYPEWSALRSTISLSSGSAPFFMAFFENPNAEFAQNILHTYLLIIGVHFFYPHVLVRILLWILASSFHYYFHHINDGGSSLMDIWALLSIFMTSSTANFTDTKSVLRNQISNAAIYIGRFQLCAVYALAAYGKWLNPIWRDGSALYWVFTKSEYLPSGAEFILSWDVLLQAATWGTLAFQSLFPILIWYRNLRPWIVASGTLLHIGIALWMGLATFGGIMMVSYLLFIDVDKHQRYLISLRSTWMRLKEKIMHLYSEKVRVVSLRVSASVVGCFVVFHCWAVTMVIFPEEVVPSKAEKLAADYLLPYFPQVWMVFGPQLSKSDRSFEVSCTSEATDEAPEWLDVSASVREAFRINRFSSAGYLHRTLEGFQLRLAREIDRLYGECRKIYSANASIEHHCAEETRKNLKKSEEYSKVAEVLSGFCQASARFVQIRLIESTYIKDGQKQHFVRTLPAIALPANQALLSPKTEAI